MKLEDALGSFIGLTRDPIIVGHRRPDRNSARVVWSNAQFDRMFGYEPTNVAGLPVVNLIAPEHRADFLQNVQSHSAQGDNYFVHDMLCQRCGGEPFWASVAVSYLPPDEDEGQLFFVSLHDLDRSRQTAAVAVQAVQDRNDLLREAEDVRMRLRLAIDAIATPLAIWDKDWRLVVSNAAFAPRLLGQSDSLPLGTNVEEMLEKAAYSGLLVDAIGREEEWIAESVAALKAGPIDEVTRYSDGTIFRATSMTASNGDTIIYNADITEFTEQRRALEVKNMQLELARAEANLRAMHDELTSLGNRRFISEGLQELLEERDRHGGEIAALAIDLDRFKQINDTQGHKAGDHVLSEVASRLAQVVDAGDLVGRIGGDEFVILRRVTGPEGSPEQLGRKIVDTMSQPFHYEDIELRLGASVGIALTPLSSEAELLTNADIALYKAKSSGRGAVLIYDERDLREMRASKRLSDEILEAVEKGAFVPFFQPQVDAETGHVVGLEALARWEHPEHGILPPSEFLQVAEEIRVLNEIDDIVFSRALELCGNHDWPGAVPSLSFNVSEERLMSSRLTREMAAARSYPGDISIELLETILFDDQSEAFHMQLDLLRDLRVGIEIDDFGSGRTSIVALEQISPDRLKIDRRLVEAVAKSERSAKLVHSIVEIGHALGIGVTAEGVETRAQLATLTNLGCDRLQGFLFGKAMSFEALIQDVEFIARPSRRARSRMAG